MLLAIVLYCFNECYGFQESHRTHSGRKNKQRESGGSDTFGSTDSEVRKILSLHRPITEHDASVGSDSEADTSFKRRKQRCHQQAQRHAEDVRPWMQAGEYNTMKNATPQTNAGTFPFTHFSS